jgi:squalene-hopene/tetraprenyl-beta-curcumene cyclase
MPVEPVTEDRLALALECARADLLAERQSHGHWEGELASSALSTATAISALSLLERNSESLGPPTADRAKQRVRHRRLIDEGLAWLAARQNKDGGFGDTDKSYSNIATTMLVDAAVRLAGREHDYADLLRGAADYIRQQGGLAGLRKRYGRDKTFAVPILTNCALAGQVPWSAVSPLPFEAALLPQSLLGAVNLPVVSYALPALIAIGQVVYHHRKPWNPVLRLARAAAIEPSLRKLEAIQPTSGGFLEATPLTSFVTMSLIGCGRGSHPVVAAGVKFLEASVRPDGSWPIDTNLATWLTSLSIDALAESGERIERLACWPWLLSCQHKERHPYTGAAPGGWAWTDLSGGVPDADDTPAALLALAVYRDRLPGDDPQHAELGEAARLGVGWLLSLQNSDGGWPTFCKGWGALPFDRSGTDLTAHALRAFAAWRDYPGLADWTARIDRATRRGFAYMARQQKADGSWLPLWFGNQDHPAEENPVYGTSRVLLAYDLAAESRSAALSRGVAFLVSAQQSDGSWGSIEETALALRALVHEPEESPAAAAAEKGLSWLVERIEADEHKTASPIGFYFAKLWYYERLYPLVFTVGAIGSWLRRRRRGRNSRTPGRADSPAAVGESG